MLLGRFISYISNPIFILLGLPYFMVYLFTGDTASAIFWTIYTWVYLFVFALFVVIGVRRGFYTDLDVSSREDRFSLYLFASIITFLYFITLIFLSAPAILYLISIGVMAGILAGSIVNTRIKASVHVAAVSALITGLALVYQGYYWLLYILIPVICWARVKIERHTVPEVIAGSFIGSILAVIMYFVALNYHFL